MIQALSSPTSKGCRVLCRTVLLTLLQSSAGTSSLGRDEPFCPQYKVQEAFLPEMMYVGTLVPDMQVLFSLTPCLKERGIAQELCQAGPLSLQPSCPLSSYCQGPEGFTMTLTSPVASWSEQP